MSELLERDPEVQTIDDALAAAARRRWTLVLVEAPAGLGKSTLLAAAREQAPRPRLRGARRPRARARARVPVRRRPPAVRGARRAARAPPSAGGCCEGSAGLAAELLGLDPQAAHAPRPDAGSPYPLLHGLHWLAANLAERTPLALVVDDAHWADELSLRLRRLPRGAARRPADRGRRRPAAGPPRRRRAAARAARRPSRRRGSCAWRPLSETAARRLVDGARAGGRARLRRRLPPRDRRQPVPAHRAADRARRRRASRPRRPASPACARSVPRRCRAPSALALRTRRRRRRPPSPARSRSSATARRSRGSPRCPASARTPPAPPSTRCAPPRSSRRRDGAAFAHPIVGRAIYEEMGATERAAAHRRAVGSSMRPTRPSSASRPTR